TQFTRAIKTLGIEPIHANSPQAKGRVERANQTLQDRLVKEMRLQGISDIETANAWLPTFIEAYNNRFATPPRIADNAHLDVHHSEEELGYIFSLQAKRVLSKNLTFQYKSSAFQIRSEGRGYRLRHSVVTVCESFNGEIKVLYDGKALGWEKYVDGPEPIPLDDEKSVHERVDNARFDLRSKFYVKPKADHPWLTRRTQSNQQVKPPKLPRKKADPDKMD
ncbi:TPA: transposase, partial [Enterobacter roggenkampii]|nr:transposase [Enterobacter roggenkampii]